MMSSDVATTVDTRAALGKTTTPGTAVSFPTARLDRLKAVIAEGYGIAPGRDPAHASPLRFSPFYFRWCEHCISS